MNYFAKNLVFLMEHTNTARKTILKEYDLSLYEWRNLTSEKAYPSPETLINLSNFFEIPIDDFLKKDLNQFEEHDTQSIRFLVLDVDGVMTDGGMYYSEAGDEFKKFNVKDGQAIEQIIKQGIQVGFMSPGINKKLITRRANKFGIKHVHVGRDPKIDVLHQWCKALDISLKETAYIGDDINDRDLMNKVGVSACPSNAVVGIKTIADIVLKQKGGDACVREFIDEFLLNPEAVAGLQNGNSE